jgi:putative transposase
MPNYRRALVPGGTFFFTVVSFDRTPFLCSDLARPLLRAAIAECRERWPFRIEAFVLLPDHLHAIWTLPTYDADYSRRWAWIKKTFTQRWREAGGAEQPISDAKHHDRRGGVWQPRFWEHTSRDVDDLKNHVEYIHYNPVKHGYVQCPHAWPYLSFHRWVAEGRYPADWQCVCRGQQVTPPKFDDLPLGDME